MDACSCLNNDVLRLWLYIVQSMSNMVIIIHTKISLHLHDKHASCKETNRKEDKSQWRVQRWWKRWLERWCCYPVVLNRADVLLADLRYAHSPRFSACHVRELSWVYGRVVRRGPRLKVRITFRIGRANFWIINPFVSLIHGLFAFTEYGRRSRRGGCQRIKHGRCATRAVVPQSNPPVDPPFSSRQPRASILQRRHARVWWDLGEWARLQVWLVRLLARITQRCAWLEPGHSTEWHSRLQEGSASGYPSTTRAAEATRYHYHLRVLVKIHQRALEDIH